MIPIPNLYENTYVKARKCNSQLPNLRKQISVSKSFGHAIVNTGSSLIPKTYLQVKGVS